MMLFILEGREDETGSEDTNDRMSDLYPRKSVSQAFDLSPGSERFTTNSNVPPLSKTAMMRGAFVPS